MLGLIWVIRILPYRSAIIIGRMLGGLAWAVDPLHRRIADLQMKNALEDSYRKTYTIKVFMNHGDIAVDAIKFAYMTTKEIKKRISIEGREKLEAALASKRGVMLITGHIGNWEILTHISRLLSIEFCVMADIRNDPKLESIIDNIRSRSGATILPPKGKALMLIRELKKGRNIGMVVDQRGRRGDKILCEYFGMPAPTNPAPAFLALKGDAIIVSVYAIKQANYYRICFGDIIDTRAFGKGRESIQKLSDYMQSWVESVVKMYPDQWFWLHSRWTRRSDMKKILRSGQDFRAYVYSQAEKIRQGLYY
ncbi:MAG: lysophospholipid acyltransferase family protein [Deltaproteobacteria bacterium]|nr:lysophospholipid acyltransferase family protein [Deltaproteobacteria bacterium]